MPSEKLSKIHAAYRRVIVRLGQAEVVFCVMLLWTIVITVFLEVVTRYIWGGGIKIASETATTALVWISFFGAAAVYKSRGHVGVQFLVNKLSRTPRLIVYLVVDSLILGIFTVMTATTVPLMKLHMMEILVELGIPRTILSVSLFAAAISISLTSVFYIMTEILSLLDEKKEKSDVEGLKLWG